MAGVHAGKERAGGDVPDGHAVVGALGGPLGRDQRAIRRECHGVDLHGRGAERPLRPPRRGVDETHDSVGGPDDHARSVRARRQGERLPTFQGDAGPTFARPHVPSLQAVVPEDREERVRRGCEGDGGEAVDVPVQEQNAARFGRRDREARRAVVARGGQEGAVAGRGVRPESDFPSRCVSAETGVSVLRSIPRSSMSTRQVPVSVMAMPPQRCPFRV